MQLIPTLEILGGHVVRLIGGAADAPIVLCQDPVHAAKELRRAGAPSIHVVDLDALLEKGHNNKVLAGLNAAGIPFQVRGGVRTERRAKELLELGARRLVLGDLPFRDWSAARRLVRQFGLRVIATLDAHGEYAVVEGAERTRIDIDRAMTNLIDSGVEHVVYNSVGEAGEDATVNPYVLEHIMSHGCLAVHARCTVSSEDDLFSLLPYEGRGLRSLIVNQALAPNAPQFGALVQLVETAQPV